MSGRRSRALKAVVDTMPYQHFQSYRAYRRRIQRHQPYVLNLPPHSAGVWYAQEKARGTSLYWS